MPSTEPKLQLGRYQLYKAGTKKIVEWLVGTASRCADISSLHNAGISKTTSNIEARALVSLAKIIVAAHRTPSCPLTGIVVTPTIVLLLQKVIDGRQASADWYATQPASDEAVSGNKSHQFFINILREVHCLLESVQQLVKSGVRRIDSTSKSCCGENLERNMNNLFAALDLEEPSEPTLGDTPPSPRQTPKIRTTPPNITLDQEAGCKEFALYCHLENLRDVRIHVRNIWLEYASGSISIVTATMITEHALGMMRITDERFVATTGAFSDWWSLPKFMSFDVQTEGSSTTLAPTKRPSNESECASRQDLVDLVCPSAAVMLRDLVAKMKRGKIEEDDQEPLKLMTECYDLEYLLSSKIDFLAMLACEFKSQGARRTTRQCHERSEFVYGLVNCFIDGVTPLWLVSACEMNRSIYEIIGSNPGCASDEYILRMEQLHSQILSFGLSGKSGGLGSPLFNSIFADRLPLGEMLRVSKTNAKKVSEIGVKDEVWIREHLGKPLLCLESMPSYIGQALFVAKAKVHLIGVIFANRNASILAMAHLYTSCRKYGLIDTVWQDMELVMAQQKSSHPLVPKRSKNADCYTPLRHFLLCLGVPASEFSHGRIPPLPTAKHVRKHSRQLVVTSDFLNTLTEASQSADQLGCSRGDLTEITLQKLADNETSGKGHNSPVQHTLIELLSVFKKGMVKDEPSLNFDYIGFCNTCSAISRFIAVQSGHAKMPISGTVLRKIDHEVAVYRLLQEATTAFSQSRSVASTELGAVASLLKYFIEQQGNEYAQQA